MITSISVYSVVMGREIVVGLHFYQPPREAVHASLRHISTDPEQKNWTAIIEQQCYEPLARDKVLKKVSFDIYQSLLLQLERINPETALMFKKSMKENGVGEPFIHPILPDLSRTDKSIVISAGVKRFIDITGTHPKIFWPPETAIDTETLEVLFENGYESFVCAPEQILQQNGEISDNQPTDIKLSQGRHIVAYPFDRSLSSDLAFNPKHNADIFAETCVKSKVNLPMEKVIIAWTDAETFGHHFKNGDQFLEYFLNSSLPNIGLYPVSINNLEYRKSKLPIGKIRERSSWSCPHGNLIRWNGSCGCGDGDTSWKRPFSDAMRYLNDRVSQILQSELGRGYEAQVSNAFYDSLAFPEKEKGPIGSLVSAKISSLIARTSCATFFSSPEVSGKINLLYAFQSLLYLGDAGLIQESSNPNREFFEKLAHVQYPNGVTALLSLEKMIDA